MFCCAIVCCVVPCCTVLCCAMQCCDVLHVCGVLCYAALCCAILCCVVLCYAEPCCAVPCHSPITLTPLNIMVTRLDSQLNQFEFAGSHWKCAIELDWNPIRLVAYSYQLSTYPNCVWRESTGLDLHHYGSPFLLLLNLTIWSTQCQTQFAFCSSR